MKTDIRPRGLRVSQSVWDWFSCLADELGVSKGVLMESLLEHGEHWVRLRGVRNNRSVRDWVDPAGLHGYLEGVHRGLQKLVRAFLGRLSEVPPAPRRVASDEEWEQAASAFARWCEHVATEVHDSGIEWRAGRLRAWAAGFADETQSSGQDTRDASQASGKKSASSEGGGPSDTTR